MTLHLEWPFEHCVGVYQVHKKKHVKYLETSEEQRLDWLDNSVFGVEFSVPKLLELVRSDRTEKKRFDLSFF